MFTSTFLEVICRRILKFFTMRASRSSLALGNCKLLIQWAQHIKRRLEDFVPARVSVEAGVGVSAQVP